MVGADDYSRALWPDRQRGSLPGLRFDGTIHNSSATIGGQEISLENWSSTAQLDNGSGSLRSTLLRGPKTSSTPRSSARPTGPSKSFSEPTLTALASTSSELFLGHQLRLRSKHHRQSHASWHVDRRFPFLDLIRNNPSGVAAAPAHHTGVGLCMRSLLEPIYGLPYRDQR